MKTMVIFFKDCDVQMFFVDKNYRGCVIYSKNMVKNEKKWIFVLNVWPIAY